MQNMWVLNDDCACIFYPLRKDVLYRVITTDGNDFLMDHDENPPGMTHKEETQPSLLKKKVEIIQSKNDIIHGVVQSFISPYYLIKFDFGHLRLSRKLVRQVLLENDPLKNNVFIYNPFTRFVNDLKIKPISYLEHLQSINPNIILKSNEPQYNAKINYSKYHESKSSICDYMTLVKDSQESSSASEITVLKHTKVEKNEKDDRNDDGYGIFNVNTLVRTG